MIIMPSNENIHRPHILVVDDEEDLCEILRFNLEAEGFVVTTALSAEEALGGFESSPSDFGPKYDLMLLDVMMDRMSGFDLARELRGRGVDTPIIFLTALGGHDDQMAGFDAGADDYIAKPFAFDTVLARVRAVLRRARHVTASVPSGLTKREFLILQLLRRHAGSYLTRAEIVEAVWPDDTCVGERSVDVHIARLRRKMGSEGNRIVNKSGFGYGLV
jgi:DNA-binding response OmpR family regulator